MLHVTLIAHTPEPERVVAAAAKLCYSKVGVTNLLDGLMQDDMRDVSADMTVMKSLMEQEGLTGGFPRPKP